MRQALPLCTEDVARLVVATTGDLRGVRDRAFVLVGFVGAFRVGELVALDAEDLDARTEGVVVRVRRAKTDQEGRGRLKPLPLAPERGAWLVNETLLGSNPKIAVAPLVTETDKGEQRGFGTS